MLFFTSCSLYDCSSVILQKDATRNVEIKARVADKEKLEQAIYELTDSLGLSFLQEDVYFPSTTGRLMLRIAGSNVSELSNCV